MERRRGRNGRDVRPWDRSILSIRILLQKCFCFAGAKSGGQKRMMKTERCLADCGRGACEKLRMPVTGYAANLKNRGRDRDLDESDESRRDDHGRGRMHDDTKRAVVGIAIVGVCVGHLSDGQQGQKSYAHKTHRRKSPGLCVAIIGGALLKSGKQEPST